MASEDKRGLKEGTVVPENIERHDMLDLSSGDILPPDANVKRLLLEGIN